MIISFDEYTFKAYAYFLIGMAILMIISWGIYKLQVWYNDEIVTPVNEEHEAIFFDPINLN